MLSPVSRNYFTRAISNSGSIYNTWADPWRKGEAFEATKRLAEFLKCPTETSQEIVNCLKQVSAADLTTAARNSSVGWANRLTIEDFPGSEEKFISERKFNILDSITIPWLVGITSDEGLLLSVPYLNDESNQNTLVAAWNLALPTGMDYSHLNTSTQAEITKKITNFYFGSDTLRTGFDVQNLTNVGNLF
jgi:carboxylesterase type B